MAQAYALHATKSTLLDIGRIGGEEFLREVLELLGEETLENTSLRLCDRGCYPEGTAAMEFYGEPVLLVVVVDDDLFIGMKLPDPPLHTLN